MFETPFSKFTLILTTFFSLTILLFLLLKSYANLQTTVVFCDVGQGDGAYIRIENQVDILVDAGPGKKILECLGRYMPFYDRTIELAIISHAQKDHYGGFLHILDRYNIKKFWMTNVFNQSKQHTELIDRINNKQIPIEFPIAGDTSSIAKAKIDFMWPSSEFIIANSHHSEKNSTYFRQTSKDLNDFSLIFTIKTDTLNALFTGDASPLVLNSLLQQNKVKTNILKVPHHGSKNGLSLEFLKLAEPIYGVISVGVKNTYGHPHNSILLMLEAQNIKIHRTDKEGDIVFKFDW